jgi:DNA primase
VIPQDFIQQLLGRVDIVEVVGRHVALRRAGANFLGLCPFHGEKSPSFTVSPAKQFYHCFGCGAHGSAVGFLMEHAGLGYVDAIRELARDAGLEVPEVGRADAAEAAREAARQGDLTRLLGEVGRFYQLKLRESPRAIDYLKGRGVSGAIAARFAIGYAPGQWRALEAAVGDYTGGALVEAGLVIDSTDESGRSRRYDRFRDRIMFPIRNARAQTIGFGGRVIDSGEPKYMNSPETPVFSKGREVYGIFESREGIRRENCVVVVEGYMDVVMLACHGIDNAVATLGTATTTEHLRKLVRLADRIVFAFDGDAAGRKAAWRALEASLAFADDARRIDFLFLPVEHDPDSFVRERGADAWRVMLGQSVSLSTHLLASLCSEVDRETAEGRAALLARSAPMIRQLAGPALRMQLVRQLADLARLEASEVERYLAADPSERGRRAGERAAPMTDLERSSQATAQPGARPDPSGGRADVRLGDRSLGQSRERRPYPTARPGLRMPVAAPDLVSRVHLILALHPGLAERLSGDADWLSESLRGWVQMVRSLPVGSTFANVCERLRSVDQRAADQLEREVATDSGALSVLSREEASAELDGAIAQLEQRWIRQALEQLVSGGVRSDDERTRYQVLLARSRQNKS